MSPVEDPRRPGGYLLGRPADRVQITDVLAALRGPREPVVGAAEVTLAVEDILGELREGEAKAAAGQTLADVLERLPRLDAQAD